MFGPRMENATRAALAALVLTAAVAPPALRHSHALEDDAEAQHRHHANHHAEDGHVHHRHVHHREQGNLQRSDFRSSGASLSAGPWEHLHFHFLGLELTLPEREPDQGDRESHGLAVVSLLSFAQTPVLSGTAQTVLTWQVFPPFTAVSPEDAALLQVVVAASPPVSSPPLCDRARRERSGVLIA
ncbi:MAG: hypothetical protein KJ000_33270 [Pirellulaceae bacterium]|nr:hypothetical protein [Pirellulaceae bacterium]